MPYIYLPGVHTDPAHLSPRALDGQRDIELEAMIERLFGDQPADDDHRFGTYVCDCSRFAMCGLGDQKLSIFGDALRDHAPGLSVAYLAGLYGTPLHETRRQLVGLGYDVYHAQDLECLLEYFKPAYDMGLAEAEQIAWQP